MVSSHAGSTSTFVLPTRKRKEYLAKATQKYNANLTTAEAYLTSRGIPIDVAGRWKLGVVVDPVAGHEPYQGRLSIPYLTSAGVVDIKYRCILPHDCKGQSGRHVKYLGEAGGSDRLFAVWNLQRPVKRIIICEGELDALVCTSLAGMPAVGISGATKWRTHWPLCFEGYSEVVIICDGDEEGRRMGRKIIKEVSSARAVNLAQGHDVNSFVHEFGGEALADLVNEET